MCGGWVFVVDLRVSRREKMNRTSLRRVDEGDVGRDEESLKVERWNIGK